MAESVATFFVESFGAHGGERAYGQRRGYRMRWFTYAQILEMAASVGAQLQRHEIKKGDRVMLWGENCGEWVAAFFGCAMRGVIVVPMDHAASADFAHRVERQVDARMWMCSRSHAEDVSRNGGAEIPKIFFEDLPENISLNDPESAAASLRPNDILQIVFTSGTTAEPKGVVITHGNVLANIAPLEREMGRYLQYERLVHPLRFLNLLPLSHVFGQFLAMFLPALLGATVIFSEEFKPSGIIATIRRERVSVLAAVPRVLQSLQQKIEGDLEQSRKMEKFRRRFDHSKEKHFLRRWWIFRDIRRQFGWKFWAFVCGGAALDADTEEFWGRLGYAAIQGYGLTETTSLVSVNHPFKLGKGSIGKVLPGREVKLAADGEILVRGDGVTSGYWGGGVSTGGISSGGESAVESGADVHQGDGWYRTGDVGAIDDSGNLYFKGRKKEVIVTSAGLNIYPEDLEAALRRQSEIKECVVVGIERDGNAEACAVVITRGRIGAKEGIDRANQSLADFQRIRLWFEWPEEDFPRTSTQKPRRTVIQAFANERIHGQSQTKPSSENAVSDLIARITGRNSPQLDRGALLDSDLGLSSLERVELIGAIEDRYQIDLGETSFGAVRTVSDVENVIRGDTPRSVGYHYPAWVLRWPTTWLRWLAQQLLIRPAVFVLGWPRIEGGANLTGTRGPLLVICNHISDIDFSFVQAALPASLRDRLTVATRGEALEALYTPVPGASFVSAVRDRVTWYLGVSLLNLFPLPREAGFRESFAYAGRAVDRGYSVLVFPEGRHSVDGKVSHFRNGIGILAKNLNIPVLPMRIDGLFDLRKAGRKFAAPGEIKIHVGRPMTFPAEADAGEIARLLKAAVEAL